jgi:hypothetical protein
MKKLVSAAIVVLIYFWAVAPTESAIGPGSVIFSRTKWVSATEPTCGESTRGTVVYVAGGAGVADTFRICTKDAANAYAYRALY